MKSIVLIAPEPPPFGGMAVQGQLLTGRLREAGLEVIFLPTNPRLPRALNLPVLRTLFGSVLFATGLLRRVRRGRCVHLLAASGTYYLLRVVPAILFARLRGVPILVNYRGGLAEAFFGRHGWWARPVLRLASLLTTPSAFLQRIFGAMGFDARVVPNVMELELFPFAEQRTERLRIVSNRNFEPIYNVALLLEAFAAVRRQEPDAQLTLAGSGSEEGALRERVEALGLSDAVTFAGRVERAQMPALLAAHRLYVNPTDVDNMPVSLLEAFASGLPVISTDAGGVPDLMRHEEHGLLVPRGDAEQLAAAILRMHREDALRERLVRAARAHGDAFEWERVLPVLLEAYEEAARRR